MVYSFAAHIFTDETAYGVEFPDVPGCFSCGPTIEEAIQNASEALGLHLEGLLESGRAIPSPTYTVTLSQADDIYAMITCDIDALQMRSAK